VRKKLKFIYSALIFLFVFSNGVLSDSLWRLLEHPWKRLNYSALSPADGIVVLSGGRHLPPGNNAIIEWGDPDRFLAGIELYRAKKSKKLMFTGGVNLFNTNLPPEGNIYIEEAILMGIPREDLFTTYPVYNTAEEAEAIKRLLFKEINSSQKEIILVTSAFHMKRAKKVFERAGMKVLPYPVDFKSNGNILSSLRNPLKLIPTASSLNKSSQAIRELIGRIIYKVWR
tara:strand:- start:430 stop:1113 length:684 start_codon:yes stop_codon:yes gene_type:complete